MSFRKRPVIYFIQVILIYTFILIQNNIKKNPLKKLLNKHNFEVETQKLTWPYLFTHLEKCVTVLLLFEFFYLYQGVCQKK